MKLKLILLNVLLSLSSLVYSGQFGKELEIISPYQEFTITLDKSNYNVFKKNKNLLPIHFAKEAESNENGEYKIKFHCTKNQLTVEEIDQEFQRINVNWKEIKPEGYKKYQNQETKSNKFILQFNNLQASTKFIKTFHKNKFSNVQKTPRYLNKVDGKLVININLIFNEDKSLQEVIKFLSTKKLKTQKVFMLLN